MHGSLCATAPGQLRTMKKKTKPAKHSSKRGWGYAGKSRVKSHEELAVDFLNKILNLNYYDCFISDQSSLIDFNDDEQFKVDVIEQVKEIYDVDITDTFDRKLVDVFDKIKTQRSARLHTT